MSTSNLEASYARAARDYESRTPFEHHVCIGCGDAEVLNPTDLCTECRPRFMAAGNHALDCACEGCKWAYRVASRIVEARGL